MQTLTDSTFWLAILVVAAVVVATAAVVLTLRYLTHKLLHWLEATIRTLAPAPVGGFVIGLARFFSFAAVMCGFTAFVLSFVIWRAPWPPRGIGDPIFWNPLFWVSWLAVMAAITLLGIVGAVLVRTMLTLGVARLRKGGLAE